jgi:hypothetical protein
MAMKDAIFYSEPASDQYEILWIWFPEEVYQWIDQLQEVIEFKDRVKKIFNWVIERITALQNLDHHIFWAVEFWVQTTLERYIVEFSMENHQSFSKEEVVFYKGAQGILLREISLWMKIFLMEEGILLVPLVQNGLVKPFAHEGRVI